MRGRGRNASISRVFNILTKVSAYPILAGKGIKPTQISVESAVFIWNYTENGPNKATVFLSEQIQRVY
jgi:hypothetical protein